MFINVYSKLFFRVYFIRAQIAFLVNKSERNLGDQRLLEYEIISKESNVKIIRLTFEQIDKYAKLDADKRLFL